MNERIKELWNNVDLQEKGNPPSIVITSERELQEFAELIVRECISVMKSTVDESIDFERKLDETSSWIESDIKRHFGVE